VTTGRLEGWVTRLVHDRERLARWFVAAYILSTVVMLFGAALIILFFLGWWR
jgi:hypothetical protein